MPIMSDVRLALRGWRRAPIFTAIAILSIALGIGATTAIFTLVDQVLLRSLPVRNPHELVQVTTRAIYGENWGDGTEISFPMYQDLRDNNQVFAGMLARFGFNLHIGYGGQTERVAGELVSGTYFPVLGVDAALGRTLLPEDDVRPGGHPVAVLSHGFWVSRFASDPNVIGRGVIINGHPYTIVGVARPGFEGIEVGRPTQVFVPIMMKGQITPGWNGLDQRRFALGQGLRAAAAGRHGGAGAGGAAAVLPFHDSRWKCSSRRFANAAPSLKAAVPREQTDAAAERARAFGPPPRPHAAAVGADGHRRGRAAHRLRECRQSAARTRRWTSAGDGRPPGARRQPRSARASTADRKCPARGGRRTRGTRDRRGRRASRPRLLRRARPAAAGLHAPDVRILAFTFGVSMLTGVLFGIAPALQSTRPDVTPALKAQAGSVLGGGQARLRKGLVASQVAVSLLLLIGAGLFIRTLNNLLTVDIGMAANQLMSFSIDPSLNGYTPERTRQFAQTVLERLNRTPGVMSAAIGTRRLLEGNRWATNVTIAGYTPEGDRGDRRADQCREP